MTAGWHPFGIQAWPSPDSVRQSTEISEPREALEPECPKGRPVIWTRGSATV
jgi:hypothetical protein